MIDESLALIHEEDLELFVAVQKIVKGRVPLIARIGTDVLEIQLNLRVKLTSLPVLLPVCDSLLQQT